MGKSTLCHALLIERKARRRLIYDPLDEYERAAKEVARSRSALDLAIAKIRYAGVARWPKLAVPPEFSLRYVPEPVSDMEGRDAFLAEARELGHLAQWALHLGSNVLIADEAHDAARATNIDPRLIRTIKRGRHFDVATWLISQRPSDIAPSARAELAAAEAWYLRLAEHVDLEVLSARRGRIFAARVMKLRPMHVLRLLPAEEEPEEWRVEWRNDLPRIEAVSSNWTPL